MGNCRVRDERLATCGSPGGRPIAALQLTALALAPALALASSLAAPACSDPRVATDQPPIAFAGYDEVRRLELGEDGLPRPIRYTLDGTRSLDPDGPGQRLAYRWHQAGGPKLPEPLAISEPKQVLLLTEPGLYTFVLVVSSAGLASIPDAANLLLLPPTSNNPPVPVLRYRPSYPVVGQEVWLDGSESTDPDPGDFVLGWLWQLTEPDGVQRLLPGVEQTSFIPQYAGPYLVTFSVLDSHRAQASIVQEIPVLPCAATGPELCNGKDDDCDGERDEDFDLDGDGHTTCNDDCDDGNPEIHGGAREVCDGVDNDCDEQTDEGFDADGDGHTFCGGDCDDAAADVHPGAVEQCNGRDDDCDDETDEGFDLDEDGHSSCDGDCDDANAAIRPGAADPCNGIDEDCDGEDGIDGDGDGYTVCEEPLCDDDWRRNPGVVEIPGNGIDEDCDGSDAIPRCPDADEDGWCGFVAGCDREADGCPPRWDCNDSLPQVHPDALEICDLLDNDCDTEVDEGFDQDGDGLSVCRDDCNDADPQMRPGLPEICDGKDNDCDNRTDEDFADADGNGIADCWECQPPAGVELGAPCAPACTDAVWSCRSLPAGPTTVCEPGLHLIDAIRCGEFQRAGEASYLADAQGTIALAAAGEVRRQYDPDLRTGALLIEGERTNHVRFGAELDREQWSRSPQLQIQPAPFAAPDGSQATHYRFTQASQSIQQLDLAGRDGAKLAYSLYLRAVDPLHPFTLQLEEPKNSRIGLWAATASWERVSARVGHPPGTADTARILLRYVVPAGAEPPGDVALWGAQVEDGVFPSSYIPTGAQPVTRPADVASFSTDFFGPERGTIALWLRPRYPADTGGAEVRLVEVEQVLRCDYRGTRELQQVSCTAGGATATVAAPGIAAGSWSFFAVTWDGQGAGAGLTVHSGRGRLETSPRAGPLQLAQRQGNIVHPLPLFALSRDVRLYSHALSAAEVDELFTGDLPRY